jgi:chromosomal replication initiation ATPase DnaA
MGCDYYIVKVLQIYYNDTEYMECELERERGYFYCDKFDEDEDDYEEQINEYIKDILTVQMKPIQIYENNSFRKLLFETKYKDIVENELKDNGKKWCEITKIVKIEKRYER